MKNFTKTLSALALMLVFNLSAWSQVTLPYLDAMDYVTGKTLNVQPTWANANTGDSLFITSGSLSYTGLAASTGNKVAFEGIGLDAFLLFTDQIDTTVYFSFLMNVSSLGTLNATGGYFSGFSSNTTTFGATVWSRLDAGAVGYNVGINPRTTTANTSWSPIVLNTNSTVLVVIAYEMVTGAANDTVKMWINPTPGSTLPTEDLKVLNTGTDLTAVNRVFIRQDSSIETPFTEMDEFRIGLTWEDVTPADITIGMNQIENSASFNVYPNPNNGSFKVNSEKEISSISVMDITGKTVYSNSSVISKEFNLNVEAGVYFVEVKSGSEKMIQKMIIK